MPEKQQYIEEISEQTLKRLSKKEVLGGGKSIALFTPSTGHQSCANYLSFKEYSHCSLFHS